MENMPETYTQILKLKNYLTIGMSHNIHTHSHIYIRIIYKMLKLIILQSK